MSYDPRTIAFLAEVIYPPIQLRADVVQTIHNNLYRRAEVSYQNFTVAQDGIHLSNLPQSPGSVSQATFLPDRLVLREELRATTVEDFAMRLVNVASVAFQTLGITQSIAQQFVVRSLITPRHATDSRDFLARCLMSVPEDRWAVLGRPIQSLGLRFTFPQTGKNKEVYNLRVETWNQDPRSLWLENVGSFTTPTPTENVPELSTFLYATYRFVTGPVGEFLSRFDQL